MFEVYAIRSFLSGRVYIGQTRDVAMRLQRHNSGFVKSTSRECPWQLIAMERVRSRDEARWIERKLKGSLGKRNTWLRDNGLTAYGSESEISEQAVKQR